ncbi:MAG: hypothetical protein NT001_02320 [Candidatus Woesearchaeota archaeon]|nr:hypothetical protein [Candidatus Woesearchaeota archaeon]
MLDTKVLIKSLYDWRTILIGVILFILIFSAVTALTSTSFGGCSGCISNGEGGVNCINQCKPASPLVSIIISYLIAYIIIVSYRILKPK